MKSKYEEKTCPYCKTQFKDDDTIVFCSACDMPHHLSCWQDNQGCTTFGCNGEIKEIVNAEESSKDKQTDISN
ncbi:MAG: RING finger protein, partial [Acutalibacteraceae bacterium]|nr:RING finger protein [Acutalibacteraceae bacterium]